MKIYLHNLGCVKNQKDGEYALSKLLEFDYLYTNKPDDADIILLNTCAFIDAAKEEAISELLFLASFKKKRCKYIIMMGCLAELHSKELFNELKEVDLFIGVNDYNKITEFINFKKREIKVSKELLIYEDISYIDVMRNHKIKSTYINTAFVKISEGCNNFCSYCSIPYIRGSLRYRDINKVIEEINVFLKYGKLEIVLISQDLTSDLAYLKKLLLILSKQKIKPKFLRLMYCNPWGIDAELIRIIKNEEFICNYLDVPIQHISDKVLSAMNRKITKSKILDLLAKLNENKIILRTTLISGFPGETEDDFLELLDLIKKEYFMWLGVFVYSPQSNTKAYYLDNKVDESTAVNRRNIIDTLQFDITLSKLEKFIDTEQHIIVDAYEDNKTLGRTYFQAPEVDGIVIIDRKVKSASYLNVKIKEVATYDLIAY